MINAVGSLSPAEFANEGLDRNRITLCVLRTDNTITSRIGAPPGSPNDSVQCPNPFASIIRSASFAPPRRNASTLPPSSELENASPFDPLSTDEGVKPVSRERAGCRIRLLIRDSGHGYGAFVEPSGRNQWQPVANA